MPGLVAGPWKKLRLLMSALAILLSLSVLHDGRVRAQSAESEGQNANDAVGTARGDGVETMRIDAPAETGVGRSHFHAEVETAATADLFELNALATADLSGIAATAIVPGDYDVDGDLDLLLLGTNEVQTTVTQLYRNDRGAFSKINVGLPGLAEGSAAWADFDNDGDRDLLISGRDSLGKSQSSVYRNDGSRFVSVNTDLPPLHESHVAWVDYDSDGALDISLSGQMDNFHRRTLLYQSVGEGFVAIESDGLTNCACSLSWSDYDGDSDLDLLLIGSGNYDMVSQLLRNDDGRFRPVSTNLPPIKTKGRAAWGDYDLDGDPDVLLSGLTGQNRPITQIYRNDNGVFTNINATLHGVWGGDANWGDYDNDGDLDIVITGDLNAGEPGLALLNSAHEEYPLVRVYRNDSYEFTEVHFGLPNLYSGTAAWGDFDGDGDLDLLLSGWTVDEKPITQLWSNLSKLTNTRPGPPQNLSTEVVNGYVQLKWEAAADRETPDSGLSYNLHLLAETLEQKNVRREHGRASRDALGDAAGIGAGRYPQSVSTKLTLSPGRYAWSVQTIDTGYARSDWSPVSHFTLQPDVMATVTITPEIAAGGQWVTATLHVANVGNYPASAVTLTVNLPFETVSIQHAGRIAPERNVYSTSNTPHVWTILDLEAGGSKTIWLTGQMDHIPGSTVYQAWISAVADHDANQNNNRAELRIPVAVQKETAAWVRPLQLFPINQHLKILVAIVLGGAFFVLSTVTASRLIVRRRRSRLAQDLERWSLQRGWRLTKAHACGFFAMKRRILQKNKNVTPEMNLNQKQEEAFFIRVRPQERITMQEPDDNRQ